MKENQRFFGTLARAISSGYKNVAFRTILRANLNSPKYQFFAQK